MRTIRFIAANIRKFSFEFKMLFLRYFFGMDYVSDYIPYIDASLLPYVLKKYGAKIGSGTVFEPPIYLNAGNLQNYNNLVIGSECYVGKNVTFDIKGKVNVGDRVTISMGSTIVSHLDIGRSRLSQIYDNQRDDRVNIGNDCYLGANTTIVPGVFIGDKCFIGAGSVVVHNVSTNSMVAGVPARLIRKIGIEDE